MKKPILIFTALFLCLILLTSYANIELKNNKNYPSLQDAKQTIYNYKTYYNERYGYSIEYPSSKLIPQGESGSGDGQVFKSQDSKSELRVYRDYRDVLDFGLQDAYNEDLRGDGGNFVVTYKKLGNNYYVISGYKNKNIFYQKTIIFRNQLCTAIITYPESEKNYYNKVCENIFRTFK
ncbi:MAG: hypothetical protein GX793_04590 [Bacteroidales bacterium]|jgi:hypothetical protein|nr:hypothetical protein [Bacteroidales bacterium]MCK9497975.1 hypothetical protein [Bacteroidales bacterium]MDY0314682.1 hypothetical protein [Bacteroidales bacterium]NLB86322.1 hypothetical protein [Bacteroidales bacterium]